MKPAMIFTATLLTVASYACNPVQQSHINANVPNASEFDRLLGRDLTAYFEQEFGTGVRVKWELLRQGPTQSGAAYPKYYAWVTIHKAGSLLVEGAVRVAAVDKERFEVTNFLSSAAIKQEPAAILSVFPGSVCKSIESRLRGAS